MGAGEDVGTDICTSSSASYLSGSTAQQSGLYALLCSSAVITAVPGKLWLAGRVAIIYLMLTGIN